MLKVGKKTVNEPQKLGECVRCGKATKLRCGKCKRACYCSTICQKLEWEDGPEYKYIRAHQLWKKC